MDKPDIKTAIPERRYRLGMFTAVVLGDVSSGDGREYRYIMAMVADGETEPGMYVTAERNRSRKAGEGMFDMRLIMRDGADVIGRSDDWRDPDRFVDDALHVARKVLSLGDEEPRRLL